MTLPESFLYDLLPAFIRNRDFYQGQPLRALMDALESEYNLEWLAAKALYEDWFIETCAESAVPAIGELLALGEDSRMLEGFHSRALVGNAIACRRRKGVPASLERVIRDASGWHIRVVELSRLLVASQSLNVLRPGRSGTVDVRNENALASLGTAFDVVPRITAVRRSGRERHDPAPVETPGPGFNLPDLGIFVWRLTAYPLSDVSARPEAPGCYRFHPLGVDTPLFNQPRTNEGPADPAEPGNLPAELRPEVLTDEIAALRRGEQRPHGYFGQQPVLRITDPATGKPIPFEAIEIADLGLWKRPAADARYLAGAPGSQQSERPVQVAIDPHRGRLAFPVGRDETGEVDVSFSYGFPSDLGGGPYPAEEAAEPAAEVEWHARVGAGEEFASLSAALTAWTASKAPSGLLRLVSCHSEPKLDKPLVVDLRSGRRLTIDIVEPGPGVVLADLELLADDVAAGSRVTLSGLWLGGRLVVKGHLSLHVEHCTVLPPSLSPLPSPSSPKTSPAKAASGSPSLLLHGPAARVTVLRSILGPLDAGSGEVKLRVVESIIDGCGGPAVAAGGAAGGRLEVEAQRSSVLGALTCSRLEHAEAVLFAGKLTVVDTAQGELRYCWVAPGSRAPYRFRCQPEDWWDPTAEEPGGPVLVSRRYGAPGYAQLDSRSAAALRTGSQTGSEIGAFEPLYRPQREAALAAALVEYLPWGLEPRVVYVT